MLVAATATASLAAVPAGTVGAQAADEPDPMIFVHGFMGSGQQFEAQALRFASNGFPADRIEMFEHDSLAYPGSQQEVWSRLDDLVADVQERTGADQVTLLGHSQGTGLVQGYLNSDPARAAEVGKYVNLDGGAGGTIPESVDALAVWGEGDAARELPGATNVRFPDQAHTEVVNSPETFATIHEFVTGEAPEFPEVVREDAGEVEVSGRALLFPQNTGPAGATLDVYEVDPTTGRRLRSTPEATFALDATGGWGPLTADPDAYYEFSISRDGSTHHIFLQRFVRSSRWVRLLTSEPGGLADSFWEFSDDHANLVVFRNKEWWADQGDDSDLLSVNGEDVLNAANSPRANRTIAVFLHDAGLDRRTDLATPVDPIGLPFLTGVDLYIPAADPPDGTVAVEATPRRGDGTETVCVPNYASTSGRVSVQLASYHHLLGPDGEPAEGHADPDCGPAPTPQPPVGPAPEPPGAPTAPPAAPVPGRPDYTG